MHNFTKWVRFAPLQKTKKILLSLQAKEADDNTEDDENLNKSVEELIIPVEHTLREQNNFLRPINAFSTYPPRGHKHTLFAKLAHQEFKNHINDGQLEELLWRMTAWGI